MIDEEKAWLEFSKNKEGLDDVDRACFYAGWERSRFWLKVEQSKDLIGSGPA
jgi:hypothetical protein